MAALQPVTPERWQQIQAIYHTALARAGEERARFLDTACAGDTQLRRELEQLLREPATAEHFLATGAGAIAVARTTRDRSTLSGRRIGVYEVQELVGAGG